MLLEWWGAGSASINDKMKMLVSANNKLLQVQKYLFGLERSQGQYGGGPKDPRQV